jgi:nitronate monooxygenase
MSFTTAVTERFGIRHPLLLAPMGAIAGGRLAAAVTRAGGLGLIGPGYLDGAWIDRQLDAAEGTRVGIGFITWDLAKAPARLDGALARGVDTVMLSFGDATPFVAPVRRAGARLILQAQSVAAARAALALGPDAIVAQGTEAGGHGAARALFPLLPAVVDIAGDVPVLAAGGISDGRGLAGALALGAAGALLGTRFYAAEEALGHAAAKARLVTASGDDTVRTTVFDRVRGIDWPAPYTGRALRNTFTAAWHGREAELARDPDARTLYQRAAGANDFDTALIWAGEGVDAVLAIEPAAAIIDRVIGEALGATERLDRLTRP